MSPAQLAYRATHHTPWYERIGDGDAVGWITAAAYLMAALLCLRTALRAPAIVKPERAPWLVAGAMLVGLGINKQLDLQVALIEFWRENALAHGWYGARRTVQYAAFGAGLVASIVGAAWLLSVTRRQRAELRAVFAGMAVIAAYVGMRAARFQHILGSDPGKPTGPGWLALVELGGIAIVAGAAWRHDWARHR